MVFLQITMWFAEMMASWFCSISNILVRNKNQSIGILIFQLEIITFMHLLFKISVIKNKSLNKIWERL